MFFRLKKSGERSYVQIVENTSCANPSSPISARADELVDYTCGDARTPRRTAPRMFAITRCSNAS